MIIEFTIALQTSVAQQESLLGTMPRAVPFLVLTCPQLFLEPRYAPHLWLRDGDSYFALVFIEPFQAYCILAVIMLTSLSKSQFYLEHYCIVEGG